MSTERQNITPLVESLLGLSQIDSQEGLNEAVEKLEAIKRGENVVPKEDNDDLLLKAFDISDEVE